MSATESQSRSWAIQWWLYGVSFFFSTFYEAQKWTLFYVSFDISANTPLIKNLRRTFFNNFYIYGAFVKKVRLRFLISGVLAEISKET